ncbi:tail fiber assembly protein [Escherichia albertii]|uniref:tail fiber assembly protein n=1 Tax=Escherichia albertii TaxID=208962 RepID=UPI00184A5DBC|nr:tail fiber assembly protein [Escherichia albertii]EFJ7651289.1 tail fiber assembly protein [Escherichia coli]EEW4360601.1 tail fiber assembly protein [Escherichia albertii]EEW7553513.1 tail fiber assembly protein [Escherichia albertii]EEX4924606.1 tail fiber assembly protein [Escherichia albertii]EFB1502960.1 tail fiber assembly protein [Escherichia albertii]
MMHLKNIKAGNPKTVEQYELTRQFGVVWLYSDDDRNWYEEQKNFQEDTIKFAYTADGIIVAVDKDVSTINPEGLSVVEVPDITANRRVDISGNWMFKDGAVIKREYTEEEQRQQAENEKQNLLQLVRDKTQLWDSQLRLGIISDENKQKLTEWMLYAQKVESIDTSILPVTFPEQPE